MHSPADLISGQSVIQIMLPKSVLSFKKGFQSSKLFAREPNCLKIAHGFYLVPRGLTVVADWPVLLHGLCIKLSTYVKQQ